MGFRSTLITQHNYLPLPEWFVEKYKDCLYFNGANRSGENAQENLPLASKFEFKTYFPIGEQLVPDIQKVMQEYKDEDGDEPRDLVLIWLHECGGITRVQINKDKVVYSEPTEWKITEGVTHHYCYGCSDVEKFTNP